MRNVTGRGQAGFPAYLRIVGRAPYDDPTATIELARKKLAEKRQA